MSGIFVRLFQGRHQLWIVALQSQTNHRLWALGFSLGAGALLFFWWTNHHLRLKRKAAEPLHLRWNFFPEFLKLLLQAFYFCLEGCLALSPLLSSILDSCPHILGHQGAGLLQLHFNFSQLFFGIFACLFLSFLHFLEVFLHIFHKKCILLNFLIKPANFIVDSCLKVLDLLLPTAFYFRVHWAGSTDFLLITQHVCS